MTAIRAIHTGLKALGIVDDDKLDFCMRLTGETSVSRMSPKQHEAMISELRRLGFKPGSNSPRKKLSGPYAGKLQALWIAGWNLGLVREREDAALLAFVKRQTGIDHTRFLRYPVDATKAIEALKAWTARAGVDWTRDRFLPPWTQVDGYRIARAQFAILKASDPVFSDYADLTVWTRLALGQDAATLSPTGWIAVMNKLGERVRTTKKVNS